MGYLLGGNLRVGNLPNRNLPKRKLYAHMRLSVLSVIILLSNRYLIVTYLA